VKRTLVQICIFLAAGVWGRSAGTKRTSRRLLPIQEAARGVRDRPVT